MTAPPLDGIRVLELGELLAGPFVGTLLGEFGADVIKIERPGDGDVLRKFGPTVNGESLFWAVNARNKKSVVLDLQRESGVEVLCDLMESCDVLINSLRPGTLEKWGLSEKEIRRRFPRLILVYATAFGRYGPYSSKGGYDPVAQGFSGLSYFTGDKDGPPMRAGGAIPVCDFMTGIAGALGAVLSILARQKGGVDDAAGQTVDVALYDVAFRMTAPLLGYFDASGVAAGRNGNHSLGGAPTGHFKTADGHWICMSVQNDTQFKKLCSVVGREDWSSDPRYQGAEQRTKNRERLCSEFAEWVATQNRGELISQFDASGLVVGTINSVEDMAADPHLAARGYHWAEHSVFGDYRVPDVVPRLSATPGGVRNAAPKHGEDTMSVLRDILEYLPERCDELRALGAFGDDRAVHPTSKVG